jgi:hypothetical protein
MEITMEQPVAIRTGQASSIPQTRQASILDILFQRLDRLVEVERCLHSSVNNLVGDINEKVMDQEIQAAVAEKESDPSFYGKLEGFCLRFQESTEAISGHIDRMNQ